MMDCRRDSDAPVSEAGAQRLRDRFHYVFQNAGLPGKQREHMTDDERENGLQKVLSYIEKHAARHGSALDKMKVSGQLGRFLPRPSAEIGMNAQQYWASKAVS